MAYESEAVLNAVKRLYATMASAAAQKAVNAVHYDKNETEAERLAGMTARWLGKAGAHATNRHYANPRLP